MFQRVKMYSSPKKQQPENDVITTNFININFIFNFFADAPINIYY